MSSARLSPSTRYRFLLVVEMLLNGTVRLGGRVAALDHSVRPFQILIEVAASGSAIRLISISTNLVHHIKRDYKKLRNAPRFRWCALYLAF